MNAKMKYFYEYYKSMSETEINEIRCYMIFDRADNDLKNELLNLLLRHEKLNFLEGWSKGVTVDEHDFMIVSKEVDEIFSINREVGGKLNAEEFIQYNQGSEYISSFKNLLETNSINFKEEIFSTTIYYTVKDIYNLIRFEDPLVISVILDKMDKQSNTFPTSKELRSMFGVLPKSNADITYTIAREMERVLERKLSIQETR